MKMKTIVRKTIVRIQPDEDENNSPKNLNDKNQQASSQKFRQLIQEGWYVIKKRIQTN